MKEEEFESQFREQLLMQHASELEGQIVALENKKTELQIIKQSLSDLSKQKGKDILFPVGSGILAHGKIADTKELLINVGANVVLPKSVEEAKQLIDEQVEEISKLQDSLRKELSKLA
jgi:prefoldin alpha subunit